MEKEAYSFLKIRKRPWYIWLLRVVWLLWLIFWAEVMIGSFKEIESRAFLISLVIFLISLLLGFILWIWGYKKVKKVKT